MKIMVSMLFLLLVGASLHAQTTLTGVWNTGTDNSQVEITEVDGRYVGTLIASDSPDANIGNVLLKDLEPSGKGWTGKMFAPKRGEWYDAKLQSKGDLLLITVGSGFMKKTLEWTKE